MSGIVALPLSNESLLEQVNELRALIPERERQLVQLNTELNNQIKDLIKERDTLLGQVSNFETWRKDLIEKTQQQIKQKEAEHQQSKAIITGVNRSREKELQREIYKVESSLKAKTDELEKVNREIERLSTELREQETLLKSRDEELERLKSIETKLDYVIEMNETILSTVTKNNNKLVETLNKPDVTIDEVKKTVKNNERVLTTNINAKQRVQQENELILRYYQDGKTQKEIADILWPDISSRYGKICERLKTKWFDGKIRPERKEK